MIWLNPQKSHSKSGNQTLGLPPQGKQGGPWRGEAKIGILRLPMFRGCFTPWQHAECFSGVGLLMQFYMLPHSCCWYWFGCSSLLIALWTISSTHAHAATWITRSKVQPLTRVVCLLVGCLTSQQHASVSQGQICSHNGMCCHIEIEVADQTFYLTQSQYPDTRPTSPSADPLTPST